jgi:hypothetical protein
MIDAQQQDRNASMKRIKVDGEEFIVIRHPFICTPSSAFRSKISEWS